MTTTPVIDLNADLGEGAGHDDELLELVTSANIACGAHAGDDATVLRACQAAVERGVVIGAHPGYPDRENFGRQPLVLSTDALAATLSEQFALIVGAAGIAGGAVRYVKAHGALYHRIAVDPVTATVFGAQAAASLLEDPAADELVMLAAPVGLALGAAAGAAPGSSSPAVRAPRRVTEGFADRAYELGPGGIPTLRERSAPGAVLEHDAAVTQAVALATTGLAMLADGTMVPVHPRSICVHGDTPGAVALAREIRAELGRAGVRLEAFAR